MLLQRQPFRVLLSSNNYASKFPCRGACDKRLESIARPDTQPTQIGSYQYCINQVRKYDRENYLAALCIKNLSLKRCVFSLRAFNVELSLIRDATTNSDRAKLRFNFWAKLIEEIVNSNDTLTLDGDRVQAYYRHAPVAKELIELFHLVDIDESIQKYLENLIGSRLSSKVLGYKLFETFDELELYCSKSNSSIYHLCHLVSEQINNTWFSNYDIGTTISQACDHIGKAHGLSNIIRGIPYNSSKNCCYIPKDLISRYRLIPKDLMQKQLDGKILAPVVEDLASRCQDYLNQGFYHIRFMPNHFRNLFLPRIAIQKHLNKLKRCNYNICDSRLYERDNLLPLNFWLSSKYFRAPIF